MNRTDPPREFHSRPVSDARYRLAEGPVWDAPRQRVLWVDIDAGAVLEGRWDGDRLTTTGRHDFAGTVGAVVAAADGELLVAAGDRLVVIGTDGRRRQLGAALIPAGAARRLNDGGCDPAGRFLVGSLATDGSAGQREMLWRREFNGSMTVLDDDLVLSNGLAWSADGTRFYSVDTTPATIWVRDYQSATGQVGPREVLFRLTDGSPDGLCVDTEGNLWVAVWGAGQVRCYTPAGTLLAVVTVPTANTSCPAFVGPHLDRLLITTAAGDDAGGGGLYLADVGVSGLPVPPWRPADT